MGFELFDGHTLSEAMPSAALGSEPQLSPRRHWWWTGAEWVMAGRHPDGCAALGREFKEPQLAAPPALPPVRTAPLLPIPVLTAVPTSAPAPAVVPEQPHPEWVTGSVTVHGPSYVAPAPDRWEPLRRHRTRIAQGAAALAVLALGATLVHAHQQGVRADALKTITADLKQVAQFEHMANVYDDSYASPGQLLRNGWTSPKKTVLTFDVVRRTYCVTGTLHGVTRTVRQDEVVSTVPC